MKKTFLILGSAALTLGLVMWLCGMTALKWDFWELDPVKYEHKTYESAQAVTSLDLDMTAGSLVVKKGDAFSMDYHQPQNNKYVITEEAGKLTVKNERRKGFWPRHMFNGLKESRYTFTITVPGDLTGLKIDTLGGVRLEQLSAGDIKINGTNGDIKLYYINADNVSIKTTNGELAFENCDFESLTSSSYNGDISMKDVTSAQSVSASSTNGQIKFDRVQAASTINVWTTNGDVKVYETKCALIKMTTTNGEVKTTVECPDITAKSVNGGIKITVRGSRDDYAIRASTVNGSVNEGNKDGAKWVRASTVNGDVKIYFEPVI